MGLRLAFALLLAAGVAAPAWASDTPRYQPAPSWVLPAPPVVERSFPRNDELALFAEVYDNQGAAPQGQHWFYRIERSSKRQCWYLREAGAKAAPGAQAAAAAPEADTPTPHPVQDARAVAMRFTAFTRRAVP